MTESTDLEEFDKFTSNHHNAHAALLNCGNNTGVKQMSQVVNHLASIIVNSGLAKIYIGNEEIDIIALKMNLRWQGFIIMKLEQKGKSFYFMHRSGVHILFGRTNSLKRDYSVLVGKLLDISSRTIEMSRQLKSSLIDGNKQ